jgi:S-DNA-T family DNA segregation ATPase FtsK/SpoIIIE
VILRFSVRDERSRRQVDVELMAEPASRVADLVAALPVRVGGRTCTVDGVPLDPDGTVGDSPLLAGCTLVVGATGARDSRRWPGSPSQAGAGTLHVVTGPAAGKGWRLRAGEYRIGRAGDCELSLPDPDLSDRHCVFAPAEAAPDGGSLTSATVEDLGSATGTAVDGQAITGPTVLAHGATLQLGASTLVWDPAGPGPLAATRTDDGRLEFDRRFAAVPEPEPASFAVPGDEEPGSGVLALVVSGVAPILMGGAAAVLFAQPAMLLFGLLAPVTLGASWVSERGQRRRRARRLDGQRAELTAALDRHVAHEIRLRRGASPDPASVVLTALGRTDGVWTRRADSPDGLVLRVGTADEPASVALSGPDWPRPPEPVLEQVPVTVDLRSVGVLGVTGDPSFAAGLARWLLVQLVTSRPPESLRLVVITAGGAVAEAAVGTSSAAAGETEAAAAAESMAWARWLPHVDAGPDGGIACWVGNTPATRRARVAELRDLVVQRREAARGGRDGAGGPRAEQDVVVLLDDALAHRDLPGMKEVLRHGPGVGVHTIAVDRHPMNECGAECRLSADGSMQLVASTRALPRPVAPDLLAAPTAARVARALAPMRDRLARADGDGSLPDRVRLLDLLGTVTPTGASVAAAWAAGDRPRTEVVIGADAAGPVTVDLAGQGPHTMLGGTTGAGKSVLLQTLIAALIVANPPDRLNLVLVDFKGGGAFLPFAGCPHVVTLIRSTGTTPADIFDEAAAGRVLASVRAEVRYREWALAEHGGEIDAYWAARRGAPSLPPLPRLVIVLDEFARVLDAVPDFLRELVAVAGKGRSLGMHLVLATQSLQGKLTPELKNNIDLRITLRQNEPADSVEVLGVPDAAALPGRLRGRGLILCTKDERRLPRAFQCGYLGDPPPDGGPPPVAVREVGWAATGAPRPSLETDRSDASTDLDLIVAAVRAAGECSGLDAPRRPVQPPLPARLAVHEVGGLATAPVPPGAVPFGLLDDPDGQAQPAAVFDLDGAARLMVAGGPQSGRTTFVRAFVRAAVARFGPDRLHLYLVQDRDGGLDACTALPQCGAVIGPDEPDRLRRLVDWLHAEADRRRTRGTGVRPWIVLVVDGWEKLENRADPAFVETGVLRRLREVIAVGPPLGIHVIAVGGQDFLRGRLPDLYATRLLLPFPQEDVRRAHLAQGVVAPPVLPGRAVDAATGLHVQIATTESVAAESVAAESVAGPVRAGRDARPRRFPPLPSRITERDLLPLLEIERQGSTPPRDRWFPIGVGGPHLGPVGLDLFDGTHLAFVSGPHGSGRTSCALTVVRGLHGVGAGVLVLAPPRSPLVRDVADTDGVRVLAGTTIRDADLRAVAQELPPGPFAVVVDDCEQIVVEPSGSAFEELPTLLHEIAQPSARGTAALVLAGDLLSILTGQRRGLARVVAEILSDGLRVLLTPPSAAVAREHGVVLESDQFVTGPAGRGYLASGPEITLVQWLTPERLAAARPRPARTTSQ